MSDLKFDVLDSLGILSENSRGWKKEVNIISWNGNKPKIDIRDWAPEHEKMGKGITLTESECRKLFDILKERFEKAPK